MNDQPRSVPVFICYRRHDGKDVAERVHDAIHKAEFFGADDVPSVVDAYLDVKVGHAENWQAEQQPFLKEAEAFILIGSPEAKEARSPEDEVHKEIDWWLDNRTTAPVFIDPVAASEGEYVPAKVATRWPMLNRITVDENEWLTLADDERHAKTTGLRAHILKAVLPSQAEVYRRKQRRGRVLGWTAAVLGLFAAVVVIAGLSFVGVRESVRTNAGSPLVAFDAGPAMVGWSRLLDPSPYATEIPAFAIDEHEVSNAQYHDCDNWGPCDKPAEEEPTLAWSVYSEPENANLPVLNLKAEQAKVFCAWLDRRLPWSVEWERSIGGPAGLSPPVLSASPEPMSALGGPPRPVDEPGVLGTAHGIVGLADNVAERVLLPDESIAAAGQGYEFESSAQRRVLEVPAGNPDVSFGFRCAQDR